MKKILHHHLRHSIYTESSLCRFSEDVVRHFLGWWLIVIMFFRSPWLAFYPPFIREYWCDRLVLDMVCDGMDCLGDALVSMLLNLTPLKVPA